MSKPANVEVLTVRNLSILPDVVRPLFPETGYLYLKLVEGGYEIWESTYEEKGEDTFREKVSILVGLNMIKSVRIWNKVALDLEKSQMERRKEGLNALPIRIAGFDRVGNELLGSDSRVVYVITDRDVELPIKTLENKVIKDVFEIDRLEF